jgi:predicted acylesterase/phospholipase RssA
MKRRSFLALTALGAATSAMPVRAQPIPTGRTGRKALVLIGGANRGAYEAGVIQALVDVQRVSDGQPLDFDLICGASIGALNGFMVATAQYATMRELWQGIVSSKNIFRLKPQFSDVQDKQSGVINRLMAAIGLALGITSNVKGVLDPEPLNALMEQYVSPAMPTHLPLYISTTNITHQVNQMFVRRATTALGNRKQQTNDALLADYPNAARTVTDDNLRKVLFASAAIPILFDPVKIARENDPTKFDEYLDGGVTQNLPIDIALRCADTLHIMLVTPVDIEIDEKYDSALDIGLGMFATMQERMLVYQVRLAYALHEADALPFTPYVVRPEKPLPGDGADFNDQASLSEMWQRGYVDMTKGWVSFVPPPKLRYDAPM